MKIVVHTLALLFIFSLSSVQVQAKSSDIKFKECFVSASALYNIDFRLLIAIAQVESSINPNANNKNKRNGKVISEDVGVMQINSTWFPVLRSMGITRDDLIQNPCQNIHVGAWVLAKNISSNGVNWESVGAYNAGFKEANALSRKIYVEKVYKKYIALTGER